MTQRSRGVSFDSGGEERGGMGKRIPERERSLHPPPDARSRGAPLTVDSAAAGRVDPARRAGHRAADEDPAGQAESARRGRSASDTPAIRATRALTPAFVSSAALAPPSRSGLPELLQELPLAPADSNAGPAPPACPTGPPVPKCRSSALEHGVSPHDGAAGCPDSCIRARSSRASRAAAPPPPRTAPADSPLRTRGRVSYTLVNAFPHR